MQYANDAAFRSAFSRFATGVTVITSRDRNGDVIGMTANSFSSVSLAPPTVLVSLMNGRTLQAITRTGRFGVNVLPATARDLSSHFAGRPVPGLSPDFDDADGMPKLTDALAYFDCTIDRSVVVNDHTLVIGAVHACAQSEARPLVFFSSRYHDLGTEMRSGPV